VQPRGPYRLGGFCASGLVAFELARILRSDGETVEALVLMNSSPMPSKKIAFFDAVIRRFGRDARLNPRLRDRFCYNLARLHAAAVSGPFAGFPAAWRALRSLASRSHRPAGVQEPQPFEKRRGARETESSFAHLVAAFTYHPKIYDGAVTLLWGEDQTTMFDDPTMGWGAVAKRVDFVSMRGGHVGAVHERIEELASTLRTVLGA
jgi:thioesterase domain-containing protein